MTITLPDEMRDRIESLMKRGSFPTAADLIVHLIEEAETDAFFDDIPGLPELTPRNREELERMLEEGMNSGPVIEATPEFWAERRRRIEERVALRRAAGDPPAAS
jgi:Arc/MetJ-type ribon-helix-helix transcriptional regulator